MFHSMHLSLGGLFQNGNPAAGKPWRWLSRMPVRSPVDSFKSFGQLCLSQLCLGVNLIFLILSFFPAIFFLRYSIVYKISCTGEYMVCIFVPCILIQCFSFLGREGDPGLQWMNQATVDSWPHLVFLFIDNVYFCTGSLISNEWVLTAAHCMDGLVLQTILSHPLSCHVIEDYSFNFHQN